MFKQLRESQENVLEALEQSFVELVSALEELQVADEALSQQVNELTTVKMELERERQRYQSLFQFLEDGYLITDKDGKIQEANAAASAFFHRPIREIIGKPITIFIHDDDRRLLRGDRPGEGQQGGAGQEQANGGQAHGAEPPRIMRPRQGPSPGRRHIFG